jgi:hypothetical protein
MCFASSTVSRLTIRSLGNYPDNPVFPLDATPVPPSAPVPQSPRACLLQGILGDAATRKGTLQSHEYFRCLKRRCYVFVLDHRHVPRCPIDSSTPTKGTGHARPGPAGPAARALGSHHVTEVRVARRIRTSSRRPTRHGTALRPHHEGMTASLIIQCMSSTNAQSFTQRKDERRL